MLLITAIMIWVAGLLTAVPYATYHLFFHAQRDQYALLITFVLFWIFGYWGVAGPILAAIKIRRVFRALEQITSKEELMKALQSEETKEVAIDFIASENHIPRFLAVRVFRLLVSGLSAAPTAAQPSPGLPSQNDLSS